MTDASVQVFDLSASDLVKNLNASVRRPSKLSLIDGPRTPALKLLSSGLSQIRWCGTKGANSAFFFDIPSDITNLNSPLSIPRYRICNDPEGNNFNAGVCLPSIMGSFDERRMPAFRFVTRSAVTIPRSPRLVFF